MKRFLLAVMFCGLYAQSALAGGWDGWKDSGRDFGYLPGAEFTESGNRGFKTYYRCTDMQAVAVGRGKWKVGMDLQYGNDKGGDLEIIAWKKGQPDSPPAIRFRGYASVSGLPDGAQLGEVNINAEQLCQALYETVENQRELVKRHLMRKNALALGRFYASMAYVPGQTGMFIGANLTVHNLTHNESGDVVGPVEAVKSLIHKTLQGATDDAEQKIRPGSIVCMASAVLLPTAASLAHLDIPDMTKNLIYLACAGNETVTSVVDAKAAADKAAKNPPMLAGALKAELTGLYPSSAASAGRPEKTENSGPAARQRKVPVKLEIGYAEPFVKVKNVFFEDWR
ncbi:MAG: hypothetical protein PHP45_04405 [Elusimicrobiales bacterium]|nr:hypothetical protein [Elusimicrobiales bacterium]